MTYIPDCRNDENYNQKYLNKKDSMFLAGYDWAVNEARNLFNNIDVYPEAAELLQDNAAVIKEGKLGIMTEALSDWMESNRDELITSMIDGMDEEEYRQIKKDVDERDAEVSSDPSKQ